MAAVQTGGHYLLFTSKTHEWAHALDCGLTLPKTCLMSHYLAQRKTSTHKPEGRKKRHFFPSLPAKDILPGKRCRRRQNNEMRLINLDLPAHVCHWWNVVTGNMCRDMLFNYSKGPKLYIRTLCYSRVSPSATFFIILSPVLFFHKQAFSMNRTGELSSPVSTIITQMQADVNQVLIYSNNLEQ